MIDYTRVEGAVLALIKSKFTDILNDDTCRAADIDHVFASMMSQDADYGFILDYGDGRRRDRPPFGTNMWIWSLVGFLLVRFRGDVPSHEEKTRQVIDRLVHIFDSDPRLGGLVPLAQLTLISKPEPETISDIPFYWVAVNIEVIDK